MANVSQLIQYYHDCYESDNRETGIPNLLDAKYRHATFLSGTEDLLRAIQDRAPVDRACGLAAQKEAELYKKDKTLVYGAFPLVGYVGQHTRLPKRLCAPLLFWPATVEIDDSTALLSVDLTAGRLNLPVLMALAGQEESSRSALEDLLSQIPQPPFRRADIHALSGMLLDCFPEIDVMELSGYPNLMDEKAVRDSVNVSSRGKRKPLRILPACAMALIPNSPRTRGVLFELEQTADSKRLSAPVRRLLGDERAEADPGMTDNSNEAITSVPAVLSHAQQAVLRSARSAPLTLVIGPPGTGKSYTIAALALDHLRRGQSVLVASRMNQAVDVVARKIEAMIGPNQCVIRGGRSQYLRDLKHFLQQILHGMRSTGSVVESTSKRLGRELTRLEKSLARLEQTLRNQSLREEQWGRETIAPEPGGLFSQLVRKGRLHYLSWRLAKAIPLWQLMHEYQNDLSVRSLVTGEFLQETVAERLAEILREHRGQLSKFLQAIRARSNWKQEKLFSEIRLELLLETFPIWLTTLADVSEVLPLRPELFDLAILDESTQCDVASCLPLLQRARRAVIVGDPNQLRHVSFLSSDRQQTLAKRNGLSRSQQEMFPYRQKSVLDVLCDTLSSQDQVLFLNEHFRSMPQIIAFSNREFYADSLSVMTRRPETAARKCVTMNYVQSGCKSGGTNREEAERLVDQVVAEIKNELTLSASLCHSMGVLSPFRDQADLLMSLLEKRLSLAALQKHDLLVGTAHSFQGEERDVMFLSLVVDPDAHPASFRFLNNPNVFNVAITRARNEQYVFCSVRPEMVKSDTLLRRYLDDIAQAPEPTDSHRTIESDAFLNEVRNALEQEEFRTWPAYPAAGLEIDLVVQRGERTIGIDLIGYPGEYAGTFDLERYRMLKRAGLDLFPLPYRAWHRDKRACIEAILSWHDQLKGGRRRRARPHRRSERAG